MSSEPEMSDAQFTNVFSIMIGGLILLTIALVILAAVVASGVRQSDINQQARDNQVVERIEPAGQIAVGSAASGETTGETAAEAASGESVYQSSCAACHAAGVAGAPTYGEAEAWSGRIEKGIDTLYEHAINGFQGEAGMMPPKGGFTNLSDEEVQAAVDYMVEAVAPGQAGSADAGATDASETEPAETQSDETGTAGSETADTEAADTEASETEAAQTESTETEMAGTETAETETADTATTASEPAADEAADTAATSVASGETVYQSGCAACHDAGVAGAPTQGDAEAWSDRIAKGMDTLYEHAINGFQGETGMMPPKGGFTNLSDEEVRAAVDYMVEAAQ